MNHRIQAGYGRPRAWQRGLCSHRNLLERKSSLQSSSQSLARILLEIASRLETRSNCNPAVIVTRPSISGRYRTVLVRTIHDSLRRRVYLTIGVVSGGGGV